MIKYPSIGQFRTAKMNVSQRARYTGRDELGNPIYNDGSLPTLKYVGTPKLHGCNASLVQYGDGTLKIQSRNREITMGGDMKGFARFCDGRGEFFIQLFKAIRMSLGVSSEETLAIYGEWCGKGIMKGSGLSSLEKMFVIFSLRIGESDESTWATQQQLESLPSFNDESVRNIFDFPHYEMEIDFEDPGVSQNTLIELTTSVENECPVAKAFGVEGGVGEGIVWKCSDPKYRDSKFWFKVKGEKHSATKVKTLSSLDLKKIDTVKEFVDSVITVTRLEQAVSYMEEMNIEMSQKSTGDFIRWVLNDVMKEEEDVLDVSGLSWKDTNKAASFKARKWFFAYLKSVSEPTVTSP